MTQDVEMKDHTAPLKSVSSHGPSTLHRMYRLKVLSIRFKLHAMFSDRDLVGRNENNFKF